jgi:hypothetical protein
MIACQKSFWPVSPTTTAWAVDLPHLRSCKCREP